MEEIVALKMLGKIKERDLLRDLRKKGQIIQAKRERERECYREGDREREREEVSFAVSCNTG